MRLAGGLALLVVGVICSIPGVPGPGILMVIAALLILREHFTWARKAVDRVQSRIRWFDRPARATGTVHNLINMVIAPFRSKKDRSNMIRSSD